MNYRLAIFDFDGTLADSAEWFLANLGDVADLFGFRRVSDAEIEALRGLPNREIVKSLGIPPWKMPRIARHMRALVARDAGGIPLFAGAGEMLHALHEYGLALAIVSSNSEANVRTILGPRNAGLVDRYECGASLFGKAKKLRRAARRLGVAAAEAIAIGDETRDIEAAEAAGMASAAVAWGYARPEALAGFDPDFAFASMDEIASRLAPPSRHSA